MNVKQIGTYVLLFNLFYCLDVNKVTRIYVRHLTGTGTAVNLIPLL